MIDNRKCSSQEIETNICAYKHGIHIFKIYYQSMLVVAHEHIAQMNEIK